MRLNTKRTGLIKSYNLVLKYFLKNKLFLECHDESAKNISVIQAILVNNLLQSIGNTDIINITPSTHVKISQLVASLQTSHQQVVSHGLLQVVNKFGTSC